LGRGLPLWAADYRITGRADHSPGCKLAFDLRPRSGSCWKPSRCRTHSRNASPPPAHSMQSPLPAAGGRRRQTWIRSKCRPSRFSHPQLGSQGPNRHNGRLRVREASLSRGREADFRL